MPSQLFAVFARLTAAVGITAFTALVPSASSKELAKKELIRTDRYGDPLPEGAVMRLGTARFSQAFPRNLIFSPDGKLLISAGGDKRIRVWDAETGKERRALDGHTGGAYLISLSADGKWLASCGFDSELFLWEFDTGKVRQRFLRSDRVLHALSLSPNGKILATSDLSTLRLWDTATGKETLTLPHPRRHGPEALAFTSDSKQLAYSDFANQDIHVLDVATGKEIRTFKSHKSRIYQLIFTSDGATLFSCSFDHTIRSWDVASGKEKQRYGDEKQTVGCFALAPDGRTLTYSTGSLVHIWDLQTNKDRMPPCKSKAWITPAIAYSPDSKKVAVGGEAIAIYETATGKRLNPGLEWESPVHQIKYALGGKKLLVWRWYDKAIELWDTAKWRKTQTLRPKTNTYFTDMIVSPNGKYLTTGEGDTFQGKRQSIICTWNLETGQRQREFPLNDYWFDSLSYSTDGKTIRYRQGDSKDQAFVFRDVATSEELRRLPALLRLPGRMAPLPQWKPLPTLDGRVLAWGALSNGVGLWDTKTGKLVRSLGEGRVAYHFPPAFSPDERMIAIFGNQVQKGPMPVQPGQIVLWEMATGKERVRMTPNDEQVTHIVFSPDGRLLASAGRWEMIQVWDTWTGKEVGRFTGHRGPINTLSFAPDSKTLASGSADNTILIWDVSGLAPMTKAKIEKMSREKLAQCWDDLAGTDAARAYTAIAEFARHPDEAESLFKDKLAGLKRMDMQRLTRLIADLDSDDFKTRESASNELARLGQSAERALRENLEGKPSVELKRRIQDLLDKLDRNEDDPEQRRLHRAIEVLERLGTAEARRLLQKLVEAAPDSDTAREAKASLERLRETR